MSHVTAQQPVCLAAQPFGLIDREKATLIATMPFHKPDEAIRLAQLLARDRGVEMVSTALQLAIQGARRDIELECIDLHEGGARWWNTLSGPFVNSDCDNDLEFLQMRERSVAFLQWMNAIVHHPEHAGWIRFVDSGEPVAGVADGPVFNTEGPDEWDGDRP